MRRLSLFFVSSQPWTVPASHPVIMPHPLLIQEKEQNAQQVGGRGKAEACGEVGREEVRGKVRGEVWGEVRDISTS